MIAESLDHIEARGKTAISRLEAEKPSLSLSLEPADAFVGGGSLPEQALPSLALILEVPAEHIEYIKRRLRLGDPAVFCRARQGRLEFDLRTIGEAQVEPLARAILAALA
jgi:L-seryl-tRNA(Ser) seleniumtransferase